MVPTLKKASRTSKMSAASSYRKWLFILCATVMFSLLYFVRFNGFLLYQNNPRMSCKVVLNRIQPPFSAMLIDIDFLQDLSDDSCRFPSTPVQVAVPVSLSDSINRHHYPHLHILFFEDLQNRNYLKFFGNVTRAIPRIPTYSIGFWKIPTDLSLFEEYWRRSPMLECLGLILNRTESGYLPVAESVDALSRLTKLLSSLGMYSFLNGGTLLGWYRECGIISHTWDLDIAVLAEQHNPKFLELLQSNKTDFRLSRKFGRPNDTYEFTVAPIGRKRPYIDIFFMYNNGQNESWVGGTDTNGQKYRYVYPLYDPFCSVDLLGRIFWTTCRPDTMITQEYGPDWKKDHKTSHFSWNKSHFNVRKAGVWNATEMKEVYKTY